MRRLLIEVWVWVMSQWVWRALRGRGNPKCERAARHVARMSYVPLHAPRLYKVETPAGVLLTDRRGVRDQSKTPSSENIPVMGGFNRPAVRPAIQHRNRDGDWIPAAAQRDQRPRMASIWLSAVKKRRDHRRRTIYILSEVLRSKQREGAIGAGMIILRTTALTSFERLQNSEGRSRRCWTMAKASIA